MEFSTENLLLRPWTAGDFEFYASFFSDESTAQYYGGAMSRSQSWRHLASVIGHWDLRGFGVWAVERSANHELIGCAGYWEPDGWPATELAFWFLKEAYESRLAMEAVQAVRNRSTDYPDISRIVSYITPENVQARELIEEAGGTLVDKIDLFDFGEHCQYALSRSPSLQ